ncbi:hypothetical protein [uncultured Jannaschia sp.]|uniref:hypothetical protein n=1 Tax=uncultured Jannaschia sp. TaxID=293347 RepID=UPI00262708EA|nr:hypothetical protein [uncultured Jannaschia sp.]
MRFLLLSLIVLGGCGLIGPRRDTEPHVPTCDDVAALADVIVLGRMRGQSRFEQRQLVERGSPLISIHEGQIESVYDWPRPTNSADWLRLREMAVGAAHENCINRPVLTLQGLRLR